MGHASAEDAINTPEFYDRLARRERAAVEILFDKFAGDMMDHLEATKRRHGLALAEWRDTVQEVFVKFLTKPPIIDPTRTILPLLKTMVLNEARDRAKKNRVRAKYENSSQFQQMRSAATSEEAGSRIIANEARELVRRKLAKLSVADRQVMETYITSEPNRHVRAIAAAKGISVGAAQMQFVRAKARWARVLGEDDAKDER